MISWHDLYTVLCAVVPLYVAMILAYGSVQWWGFLTPDQCAGINRFVAVFALPLLSFHVISTSDPYAMDLRFVAADTLQKALVLVLAACSSCCLPSSSSSSGTPLDWSITLFSLSALPNTLVMGIPLLVAMYGRCSGDPMVQIFVLQCIVWYTLLLVLFEFRAARLLVAARCPDTAASIANVHVDHDVVSLEGSHAEAWAQVARDGRVRLVVQRRRSSSRRSLVTPRPSDLTGVEIYSASSSSPNATPSRGSSFARADVVSGAAPLHSASLRTSSFGAADLLPLHSPRPSPNLDEHAALRGSRSASAVVPRIHDDPANKDGHNMFEWTSDASAGSTTTERQQHKVKQNASQEKADDDMGAGRAEEGHQTAPAGVMTRLILTTAWRRLIRNPNTYASLLGLTWSLIAFRFDISMPTILRNSITILSDAGLGMAMFSLGLFMAMQPKIIACGTSAAAVSMAIRFLFGPAVMAAASVAVGLRGTLLRIAIVQAALPQGIVPFVFAKEYDLHAAILCTGVIFGMLIALPIALAYYIILRLM